MIKVMKGKVTKTEEGNLVYDGTVAKIVSTMDLDFKYIHHCSYDRSPYQMQ